PLGLRVAEPGLDGVGHAGEAELAEGAVEFGENPSRGSNLPPSASKSADLNSTIIRVAVREGRARLERVEVRDERGPLEAREREEAIARSLCLTSVRRDRLFERAGAPVVQVRCARAHTPEGRRPELATSCVALRDPVRKPGAQVVQEEV